MCGFLNSEEKWVLPGFYFWFFSTDNFNLCYSSTIPFQILAISVERRTSELKHLFLRLQVEEPCTQCRASTCAPVCEWNTLWNKVSQIDPRSILTLASLFKATHDFSLV